MFTLDLWAVHISDGVLTGPTLAGGYAVAGLLTLLACWRVREEEIPRIAILTAAFFLASSIHVRLGPTSVHLLLSGLVGVVLGWRAPLAILSGVTLQALLLNHGGLTTIGVNAATEMLPALAAAGLCPLLLAATRQSHPWLRSSLVAAGALLWGGCLALGVGVLLTNPLAGLIRISSESGLVLAVDSLEPALRIALHPAVLACVAGFVVACLLGERRVALAVEFPAGAFVGVFAVIATTLLTGLVLVCDGAERWSSFATVVFLTHLPLALVEGLILGTTVGFLARVKPEMLRGVTAAPPFQLPTMADETCPIVETAAPAVAGRT